MAQVSLIDNETTWAIQASDLTDLETVPVGLPAYRHGKVMNPNVPYHLDKKGRSWWGLKNRQEMLAAVQQGWPEGVEKVRAALGELRGKVPPSARSTRRRKVWGDEGDVVCADRLLSGHYDQAFQRTRRELSTKTLKTVRIFCNTAGHSKEAGDSMFWAGAAAIGLIDALEDAGYRTELFVVGRTIMAYESKRNTLVVAKIKGGNEPLDIDRTAACLCISGFFRSYIFRAIGAAPEMPAITLGMPMSPTPDQFRQLGLWSEGDVIIPAVRRDCDARRFIEMAVAKVEGRPEPPAPVWIPTPLPEQDDEHEDEPEEEDERDPEPVPQPETLAKTTVTVDGETYIYRKVLREWGFDWDKTGKVWRGQFLARELERLRRELPTLTFKTA